MGRLAASELGKAPWLVNRKLIFGAALNILTFSITLDASRAQPACEMPNVYGSMLFSAGSQGGEFIIKLKPPNYQSHKSVQDHYIFSKIWGSLIGPELQKRTRGACDAIVLPSVFPNLWAFLEINVPSSDPDSSRARCKTALKEIVTAPKLDPNAITRAGIREALAIDSRKDVGDDNYLINIYNIIGAALPKIYEKSTIMHSLASISSDQYRSIDSGGMLEWLKRNDDEKSITVNAIPLCAIDTPHGLPAESNDQLIPYSRVVPPGNIDLTEKAVANALPAALRSVVIVGLSAPYSVVAGLNTLLPEGPLQKYCNKKHSFETHEGVIEATIRCDAQIVYGKTWLVIYCDAKDCTSEGMAHDVASKIENAADIKGMARERAENNEPRGPYLVEVRR
jgi:hypothetical protein